MEQESKERREAPGLFGVLGSVLASMFGVQGRNRHEKDFEHGKPSHYIVIGLLVTVAFVLLVWGVVQLVLYMAGI